MTYRPPTIGEVGADVATSLAEGDEDMARRLAFRFVEHFDKAGEPDRRRMVAQPPDPTGDPRYDALLAGLAEFACARHGVDPIRWFDDADRFLDQWWFVSGFRSLHANAMVHSPASLKRRGVFITEDSLTYA